MEIVNKRIDAVKLYENNPRNNDDAVGAVAESIRQFGFKVPIVIDGDGVIVCGHTRYKASVKLGLTEIPCIVADDLTPEQIKAYRLADNKAGEIATWNLAKLSVELDGIADIDMGQFGFELGEWDDDGATGVTLAERYVVPPFSVLDSRQGYWTERKTQWKSIIHSYDGRDENVLSKGLRDLRAKTAGLSNGGVSIFDPVLCEVLYRWFCPAGGKALDPFAGGSVRGIVASMLGIEYTGIDLRPEQIGENEKGFADIASIKAFDGNAIKRPRWICGDSANIASLAGDTQYDFAITCPPYGDLERYSDLEADISNMDYGDFVTAYTAIICKTVAMLKQDALFAIVVGDIRDKKGYYRDFIGDTKRAFAEAGCKLLNDMVFVETIGTGAIRCGKTFEAGRKVYKCHQNVLVFCRGNEKKIKYAQYDYDFGGLNADTATDIN